MSISTNPFGEESYNYKWIEQKTVTKGNNTFTLTNTVINGDVLFISDNYGIPWIENINFSRNGQTITVSESGLFDNFIYQILCFR